MNRMNVIESQSVVKKERRNVDFIWNSFNVFFKSCVFVSNSLDFFSIFSIILTAIQITHTHTHEPNNNIFYVSSVFVFLCSVFILIWFLFHLLESFVSFFLIKLFDLKLSTTHKFTLTLTHSEYTTQIRASILYTHIEIHTESLISNQFKSTRKYIYTFFFLSEIYVS